ncbi:MAG: MFS transporter [Chloroflexi bacterium]|nr:MFS transporter [Chloroflexota bacterium]
MESTSYTRAIVLSKASVAFAAALVFVAFLDLFAQLPVVAPYAASLGATETQVGLVVALYSVTNLGGNLVAGQLLDRLGRRPPLFAGLLGASVALALYGMSQSATQLMAVRALHGFLAGLVTPSAFTLLADFTPASARARAMGIGGSVVGAAAIVGPALSGLARTRWGYNGVFLGVSGLMLAALVVSALLLPHLGHRKRPRERVESPFEARRLAVPCLAVFGLMATLGILTAYLPVRLESAGYAKAAPGILFSVFSLAAVLTMVSPLGQAAMASGMGKAMVWGLLGVALALLVLALAPALVISGAGMVVYGVGFGLIFPAANAAVADIGGASRRGRAFAVLYAVFSLGVIAGALIAGLVSRSAPPASGGPLPLYAGMAVVLAAALGLWRLDRAKGEGHRYRENHPEEA